MKNTGGWISIILWAVFLTMILNYIFALHATTDRATSVEVTYSEFIALLDVDTVESVSIDKEKSIIYVYGTDPETGDSMIWYTAFLPEDPDLIPMLKESGVPFKGEIPVELSPILSFVVSWLLPMVVMLLLLMLVFRFLGNKAGGMGGLGGVGKANAKVYMEKSTG
ncbi:MAG: ATP-dependent metallopeptidase FtsH/Yme1/Tma family protein, partial [Oscillospiraceae bacterium]|nr:ATP-dependent metallopeptidase FtsH/Yme1/Tma family protein [Oscillospiraceae bacterium]